MKRQLLAAGILLTGMPAAAPAYSQSSDAQSFQSNVSHKLTLGAYHSRGSYDASRDTTLNYLPVNYEFATFPWIVSVTVPWLSLDGPGDVFLDAGNLGRPRDGEEEVVTASGIGDVLVGATYQLPALGDGFAFLDFTVQLKLPVADENRDLGTGEMDVSYQIDLYKALGNHTLFATLGYRQRGRTSLYDLRDSGFLSLGAMREITDDRQLGLLYDYRQPASGNAYEIHELMPFYSWSPDERWSMMLYGTVGFTPGSPDRAVGVQLSYSW